MLCVSQGIIKHTHMYEKAARQRMIKEWVDKKIKDTYVKIEDNWIDCEFENPGWLKIKK